MTLVLLLPLGLVALAAWLLPLLIHLRRRSEHRPTNFAALRWLQPKARPRRRLRLEDWPLLAVRLVLIAALALLLAQPVLFDAATPTPWTVFAPGTDPSAFAATGEPHERRWLAPGFPEVDAPMPAQPTAIGSLLRQLDAELPPGAPLTAVVPSVLDGADGAIPALGRDVDWLIVEGAPPAARDATTEPVPPVLAIRHASDRADALRYLRAASIAWQSAAGRDSDGDIAAIGASLPPHARPLAWLAEGPLPQALRDWVAGGGTVLVEAQAEVPELAEGMPLWRDADGAVLVHAARAGRGRILQWRRPLTPEAVPVLLEPGFPARLQVLFATPAPAPSRVSAAAYAPVSGNNIAVRKPFDLQPWLLLLIAALFVLERWLAGGRRVVQPA